MVKQFVDHFKVKEYGFNFFPVLGLLGAAMLADAVRLLSYLVKSLLTNVHTQFFYPLAILYPLFFGLLLVLVCHAVKNNIFFVFLFSLAYMVAGALIRLIYWVTFSFPSFYYKEMSLPKVVFNIDFFIGGFSYALAIALALFLLYALFKRLDYAVLFGFPIGEIFAQLFFIITTIIRGGKPSFELEYFVLDNPDVNTVCCSANTFDESERFIRLSGARFSDWDRAKLEAYKEACGLCEPSCPAGVPVNTIMRYNHYFEALGREKEAMSLYAAIPGARAKVCSSFPGHRERACPHGVPIQGLLLLAHRQLTWV